MIDMIKTMQNMQKDIITQTIVHLQLATFAVLIAILIGVPLGVVLVRYKKLSRPILYILGITQTIPSLAMLGFLIPFVGIGTKPGIIVLVIYSLLVIVQNTVTGINQVDPSVVESATGMGMTNLQILIKVQIPLASPVILAGVRIATVTCIGVATLVAAVGSGGLGVLIFQGIAMLDTNIILAGALPAAFLAIVLDTVLMIIEKNISKRL